MLNNEIKEFLYNTNLFCNKINLYWIEYLKFSPFVFNKIWWNKNYQKIFYEILLKKINISQEEFDSIELNKHIKFNKFIKFNMFSPIYKNNFDYWINMIFFSEFNIYLVLKNKKINNFFDNFFDKININLLKYEDIVISLDLMFDFLVFYFFIDLKNKNNLLNNNLFLMLISDYIDILNNKPKSYDYDINLIKKNINFLFSEFDINIKDYYWLNFQEIMANNTKNLKS